MARAAAIVALAAVVLAACSPATHVDGHKIRAGSADALHEGAPAWFAAWWGDYLRHARSGHAVLALDRKGQGGWYVYCGTIGCHVLDHVSVGAVRDVHYTYPALEHCREAVADAAPAAAPDCAIYAIRDTIVWQCRRAKVGRNRRKSREESPGKCARGPGGIGLENNPEAAVKRPSGAPACPPPARRSRGL